MASEYQKSSIQLVKVKKKIVKCISLRSQLRQQLKEKEKSYNYYYKEWEKKHAELENEQVILSFEHYKKRKKSE